MSNNSIIVADGGDFVGTAAYILRYWQSLGLISFLKSNAKFCFYLSTELINKSGHFAKIEKLIF